MDYQVVFVQQYTGQQYQAPNETQGEKGCVSVMASAAGPGVSFKEKPDQVLIINVKCRVYFFQG